MNTSNWVVYRYSKSKGMSINVENMHPCHIVNSMKKEMENMTAEEILEEPLFQAYIKTLNKYLQENENIELSEVSE